MKDRERIIPEIARRVAEKGGCAYYVGGYVRDYVMGNTCSDVDVEVYGIKMEYILSLLNGMGMVDTRGSDYGIVSLPDYGVDIALPRTEVRTGPGHKDFHVNCDPALSPEVACRRRDFTINAMLMDVLTHEIVDPYHGMDDIHCKVIRHIDDVAFPEDQLRVLRACQFAARFGYTISPETLKICRSMSLDSLSGPRVAGEMKKALLLSSSPSLFFENLKLMNHLEYWFPEVSLKGHVLDRAAEIRDKSSDIYNFMLLALTYDLSKEDVEKLTLRLCCNRKVTDYLNNMAPLHTLPDMIVRDRSPLETSNKMFDSALFPEDLILLYLAIEGPDSDGESFLRDRLARYLDIMSRPYITGKDLVLAGVTDSQDFSRMMELAHKLRLAGVDRSDAMKQILKK